MPRTRSSRVLWLLAELDAPCELVKLAPEQRTSAEHRTRHPLGRVPALELDDGTVMFESAAICLQLADLHPEASLIAPVGSPERALVYQWVLFTMPELEPPLFRWIREAAENSADPPSRERFAQAAAALQTVLDGRDCQPDTTPRIRIMWGQHLLEDLLAGRYRSLVLAVNAEDNSSGIIASSPTFCQPANG